MFFSVIFQIYIFLNVIISNSIFLEVTETYANNFSAYLKHLGWITSPLVRRSSVATLFQFLSRFTHVGILNSRSGDSCEVLVSESCFHFYQILLTVSSFFCRYVVSVYDSLRLSYDSELQARWYSWDTMVSVSESGSHFCHIWRSFQKKRLTIKKW